MGISRAARVAAVLLAPGVAFCHRLAPPPGPPPPPPPPEVPAVYTPRDAASLLPRRVVLGDPDRSQVQISPDGKSIGWLAMIDGVLNVVVAPSDDVGKPKPVTHQKRSIPWWRWTFRSDRIVFTQGPAPDKAASDESQHLYAVDLAKNETKDVTPLEGANAELVHLSHKRPNEALVTINNRDHKFPDAYVVDLATGVRKIVMKNDTGFSHFVGDDDLRVRFGLRHAPDGSTELATPPQGKDPGKTALRIPFEDTLTTRPIDFDKTGEVLYLTESMGRDTSALFALDTKTLTAKLVVADPHADAGRVLANPVDKTIEAVSFEYDSPAWSVVDASVEGDFYYLQTFGDGKLNVASRSLDEQHWVVSYSYTDGPTLYYRYDRDPDVPGTPGKASFLFRSKDALEHVKLSAMKPVVVKARDGTDLLSYLTIPADTDPRDEGRPRYPLPMVVLVHDGPWERAASESNPLHQWLSDRGYAVLSVNYRGSRGLGKALLNAGNLEWGATMQDDLAAVAKWAVDEKIAQQDHIAVMGEGYGGYAVLEGMAKSPFACGVDLGGPPNLVLYLVNAAPFAEPQGAELARRVGDIHSDEGKKLLDEHSPSSHVERIGKPLLIEQGKNDPRVTETDTAELALAIKSHRVQVTYVAYPDEARGLSRLQNRLAFAGVAEAFLGKCLNGPHEPLATDVVESSITVPIGSEHVAGIRGALGPDRLEPLAPPPTAAAAATDGGIEGGGEGGAPMTPDASVDGASKSVGSVGSVGARVAAAPAMADGGPAGALAPAAGLKAQPDAGASKDGGK
jgi:dipeptidyl aminopeptidase/acylaminoacyl peptidase